MGAESSRIKITAAPVIFTARGEVLLMSKGSVSNRNEFRLTSDRSELANESELTSKTEDKNNRYSGYFYRKRRSFVNE